YDIQDIGVHFYTYETTLGYCIEAAAEAKIPIYVLDRPNPITGTRVEGPLLDQENVSFVGYMAGVPVRHGMTIGELAMMFNGRVMARYLIRRGIPGLRFYPISFTQTELQFAGKLIVGIRFEVTDRENLDAVRLGLELDCALEHLYPGKVDWN